MVKLHFTAMGRVTALRLKAVCLMGLFAWMSLWPLRAQGDGSAFLMSFYKQYVGFCLDASGEPGEDSLLRCSLTPAFREKLWRMTSSCDANALLRAQDCNEQMLRSLRVEPLDAAGWYCASWQWEAGGEAVRLPVRLERAGESWRIAYVTPERLGACSGDTLFFRPGEARCAVEAEGDGCAFLRSFYDAYAAVYATLQPGVAREAAGLRKAWLTPAGQADFRRYEEEGELDGGRGYDALLCDFDFDRPLIPRIRIGLLDERTAEVHFPSSPFCLEVLLLRTAGGYRIDGLRRKYED